MSLSVGARRPQEGYDVYRRDCSGGITPESHEDGKARMTQAGAKPMSLWSVLSEWTPDYTSPERQKLGDVTMAHGGLVTLMASKCSLKWRPGWCRLPASSAPKKGSR